MVITKATDETAMTGSSTNNRQARVASVAAWSVQMISRSRREWKKTVYAVVTTNAVEPTRASTGFGSIRHPAAISSVPSVTQNTD